MSQHLVMRCLAHTRVTSPSAFRVLLVLAEWDSARNFKFPVQKIADKCHLSRRQVQRITADLEALGEIKIIRSRKSDDPQANENNIYKITLRCPVGCADKIHRARGGVTHDMGGGVTGVTPLVSPVSPNPSVITQHASHARRAAASVLPDGWEPSETHAKIAADNGLDLQREAEVFRAHAEANDRRQANWDAAFTQWLLKSSTMSRGGAGRRRRVADGYDDRWSTGAGFGMPTT